MEAVAVALLAAASWQFSASSVEHSDALALSRWSDDDAAAQVVPRGRRNIAYLERELRASYASAAWGRWSLLTRQSARITASRGALDLVVQAEAGGRPDGDRRWAVDARYFGFEGSGIAWQHKVGLGGGWRLDGGAQALVLTRWREKRFQGDASYDPGTGSYRAALSAFEASDKLDFPYRQPYSGHGRAVLWNAAVAWQGDRLSAGLSLHDAGALRWRGLPQNASVLSTDTRSVDANGFVVYGPLIEGRNSQPDRRRSAPWQLRADARWQAAPTTAFTAAAVHVPHFGALPELGAEQVWGGWRGGITAHLHERRVTLGLGWQGLQLRVGLDRPGSAQRSREAAFTWQWPL